ncbi:unnamed protein product [Parnassius mnemosyne]|uniref:Reverse transcriptase domain-containing protein n=1 Tax=Parnassius mnemosyne TaxID=213953 RepID=A0AAV1LR95_9NEOP
MFRNIWINPQHTSLQRVLWRHSKSDALQCLELDTVTYGTKSAPYLACRTMLDLADKHMVTHPRAADCIKSSSYMDDYLCGAQSLQECIQLCSELTDLLSRAGFQLHKWSANHPHIYSHILSLDSTTQNPTLETENNSNSFTLIGSVKTLGLQWLSTQDTLTISIPNFEENVPCTKRGVLSKIAQIFDPLGILAPSTILAKILTQDIWKQNTDWDSLISSDLQETWNKFISHFHNLKSINIPRYYFSDIPTHIILLRSSDASHKAYGACLYLKATYPNSKPTCTLVTAKSKVCPIKKQQSIPRLELCGALFLSKLVNRFQDATKNKININNVYLFTDSSIVLSWIKLPYKNKHSTYVTHRLMLIIDTTCGSGRWRYAGGDVSWDCMGDLGMV